MSDVAANLGTALHRTRTPVCGHWDRLATAIEKIFPKKTAWHLAHVSRLQVRSCFKFLARESSLSSDALVALLDTPHGPEILSALMGNSKERWWIEFKLLWDRERVRAELEAIDHEIATRRGRK